MLNTLKKIIDSAELAGVAINVTSPSNSELAIVFTPKLAPLSKSAHSTIISASKPNAESDFNLRKTLSTPWVMSGTPESIEEQLNAFYESAGTAFKQANATMNSSSFIEALTNATASKKTEAKPTQKTNVTKPVNAPDATEQQANSNTPSPETNKPELQTVQETNKPEPQPTQDLFNDFDEIDSI
ncbi:hypothetical protein [Pseudoalteromonas sp. Angola-7]|jgi:hypothetical protein|uniref:hypothetical protein n=1 Tax=Pseudoalteromonas sp. Angola-7 TaxID=3025336 RepID=UPI00235957EF|nr:hypothetical protein [Pseudoalteromonas sp. Angola-7]MDC9530244.1 hypothetical protein [Pseudoalteromonas sp. Angola-7]